MSAFQQGTSVQQRFFLGKTKDPGSFNLQRNGKVPPPTMHGDRSSFTINLLTRRLHASYIQPTTPFALGILPIKYIYLQLPCLHVLQDSVHQKSHLPAIYNIACHLQVAIHNNFGSQLIVALATKSFSFRYINHIA